MKYFLSPKYYGQVVMKSDQKHCKLWNVFRGDKRMKKKVKIKTQNEKIVQTDRDI